MASYDDWKTEPMRWELEDDHGPTCRCYDCEEERACERFNRDEDEIMRRRAEK